MHRKNAAVLAQGEKPVPAGIAAVRREVQQAFQPGEAPADVLARDALHVEVATLRAMDESCVGDGHHPGVKPRLAGPTAPGS